MRLLLDTHAFLWWLAEDPMLPEAARRAITDPANDVYVSAASAWEITTKFRRGRLQEFAELAADVHTVVLAERFRPLTITVEHAQRAGSLAFEHGDPFDRMLIAQAQAEDLILVSNEMLFERCGIRRIW
ncbi:MAG: type II toxin-antitoxin system VapC family toxin [Deltaproteobacteria bacterium]|nr:type II toxin-antitoxin system VapC family toxin [Deltaproteobacteria bacterium]